MKFYYNNKEIKETFMFDGKPKDMLVWNDEEPVVRQVVAKIDGDTPWIAALKGDHHEGGDEAAFGAWKHAAELNEPMMTNAQMAEYVKSNNVAVQRGSYNVSTVFVFNINDADKAVPSDTFIYDLATMKPVIPTKKLYDDWKSQLNNTVAYSTQFVPYHYSVKNIIQE